jgi:hypothetical protein
MGVGDTREVKRKIPFVEGLLSSTQNLIDFLFFRNLAGEEEMNGEEKRDETCYHFNC